MSERPQPLTTERTFYAEQVLAGIKSTTHSETLDLLSSALYTIELQREDIRVLHDIIIGDDHRARRSLSWAGVFLFPIPDAQTSVAELAHQYDREKAAYEELSELLAVTRAALSRLEPSL